MTIPVHDPTGVLGDPSMPMLHLALHPEYMAQRLQACASLRRQFAAGEEPLDLRAIRVRRHKPGRRCLIEYELAYPEPDGGEARLAVLGKIRARGLDQRSHDVQHTLWQNSFGSHSDDWIAVPEPLGVLPDLAMWLQRKVSGVAAMERLAGPDGSDLAGRIAAAIHKLQRAGVPSNRRHTLADELRILHQRLPAVAEARPSWVERINCVLAASDRLGASMVPGAPRPSHRDFYADNVIVDGSWLYLVDLDLYCQADPELDMGNFIGHVTEFGLRVRQDPAALAAVEQALEEKFVQLAGEASRAAVKAYATLTLVRHIAISTRIPERRLSTQALLELCEQRLGIACGS